MLEHLLCVPYTRRRSLHLSNPGMLLAPIYLLAFGILASGYLATRRKKRCPICLDAEQKEFPGPYLLPYIGRIHDLPVNYMWLKFKEVTWADIYGPIYKTEMLGATFLIVSDEKIAEELLVKRAKTFWDRPVIRSLFDSKSTKGSMEYLPLMGKNSKWVPQQLIVNPLINITDASRRVLGTTTKVHARISHPSLQQPLLRRHECRSQTMARQTLRRT